MMRTALPTTPKDLFKFRWKDWLLFNGSIAFFKLTGLWRYPMQAYGDLERMRLIDKLYWMYKTTNPVRRARRRSGLEDHFARQREFRLGLPEGFRVSGELSVSSVGDLINHRFLANSGEALYGKVADLVLGADLPMANLECPISRTEAKEFAFDVRAAPPLYYDLPNFAVAKGFRGRKFAFMATACNHSLDFGVDGVESTIRTLREEGIAFNGLNEDEKDALRPTILERKGFRIGLVAYTFGLNAFKPPEGRPRIVNRMSLNDGVEANDFSQLKAQIEACREEGVQFVIAHLHWGFEHEFYPTPEQVELAHHLCELGVDAIIGHHPHVVQPMEYYRTKRDPDRIAPIFYSLGNLINYFTAPYLCRSAVAQLALAKGTRADGTSRVYVKAAKQVEVLQTVDEQKKEISLAPV